MRDCKLWRSDRCRGQKCSDYRYCTLGGLGEAYPPGMKEEDYTP